MRLVTLQKQNFPGMNRVATFLLICYIYYTPSYGSVHKNLKYFETLYPHEISHRIVERDTEHGTKDREVAFNSLGREFRLILSPKKEVLHPQFKAVELDAAGNDRPIAIDHDSFYHGRVFGELESHAQVHLNNKTGEMTATIHLPHDSYHVEPSWRHFKGKKHSEEGRMLAYRSSDVKLSLEHDDVNSHDLQTKTYGYIKEDPQKEEQDKRTKRQAHHNEFIPTKTRCPLLLVADYRFFKEMGGSSTKNTIDYLISLIDRVHKIFNDTVWHDGNEQNGFTGMGFMIKKIVVHTEPTIVQGGEAHYNMIKDKWDSKNLLEVFSREKRNKDFCLAHLFTDQKFQSGFGLAYTGTVSNFGGICTTAGYFTNGYTLYSNTGLSSSSNPNGKRMTTHEVDLVTAHEFGHNWGSAHDPNTPECSPGASQGGYYLMSVRHSLSGPDVNRKRFSPCSVRSIRKVLQAKSSRCFLEPEESFCGNLRVEGDEECDAGTEDNDPCCDKNCRLRKASGVSCSDKNSHCCQDCQLMSSGARCREAQNATCEQDSYCTGKSPECPSSPPTSDGTPCLERGQCQHGQCVPFCEIKGLQSCMCDTIGDACKRCCRISLNHACFPVDPQDILPDGTSCVQGVCTESICEE